MIEGHGDDLYKYSHKIVANFSSNVYNAIDLSGLKKRLAERINSISSYPEPQPYTLEALLAEKLMCQSKNICVTNGATEAIYLIAQTFMGAVSAIFVPTFSEYEDACRINNHTIIHITNFNIINNADIIWICNPNNPTGLVLNKEYLVQLIKNNPQKTFIIDQSYEYFTLKPTISAAQGVEYNNVIMLHSMTKRYAIPGLRLGYITASPVLLEKLKKNKMPWSVNALAIEAGLYLLNNGMPNSLDMKEYLNQSLHLAHTLDNMGVTQINGKIAGDPFFKTLPSHTHYMLIKILKPISYPNGIISQQASVLKDYLANNYGILIRDASNFATLNSNYFRIATQTKEENCLLIKKIALLLQKI
ncbi:MAG: aminotransferase class I/II-fold pyridoxal phosphate-dependent enzyme [Bacteroidales bacterium]